jgi:telomerase reverse transcriptase
MMGQPLYFVKVDVQSCFDSIPQDKLIDLVETLLADRKYRTEKHVEIRPTGHYRGIGGKRVEGMPTRRFRNTAKSVGDVSSLERVLQDRLQDKNNTVVVDVSSAQIIKRDEIASLIREHVEDNIVRIGKTYHKQRKGIPQGSVLSTLLCSVFYSEFERDRLAFLTKEDSLLCRQVDDFLLMTTRREEALRFLKVMLAGDDHYGVSVKKDKTMVNFDVESGTGLSSGPKRKDFPYCGVLINTVDLNVRKDTNRQDLESKQPGPEPPTDLNDADAPQIVPTL